ncbi:MAG TPA: methylmalonyl-CoA carboxyltransferase, partial [Bifidobacterium sp.]|nr:methylmalonyl-CoA carboxyltransferase [Bifidobacterium sp.]
MTDIITSPAVKEAVKIAMEQQRHEGGESTEAASDNATQPIRASVLRAAQLAHEAEDHARERQHVKGKLTARERLDLLLDTGTFEEIGRFCGGDINGGRAGAAVITGFG